MLRRVMMAASSAPPVYPGMPPDSYSGLTFWYDGDNSAHFIGPLSTNGVAGNGQQAKRADSAASIARAVVSQGINPVRRIPVVGSSAGMELANSNCLMYAKSGTGTGAQVAASALFSAANACVVVAIRVNSAVPNAANPYENGVIIAEDAGYIGLYCYQSGGSAVFQAYNYAVSDASVSATASIGEWAIITMKHTGGQLRLRKNGGAWSSIASGNTSSLTGGISFFYSDGDFLLSQLCTYNANRSNAELLEVEKYFAAKVGLTI